MAHDDPTRRIPAQPGPPRQPLHDPAADDALAGQDALEQRLRSLRTALALVGTLAAVALGVALWTLLDDDAQDSREGASAERVARLDDRVDRFEDRLDQRATKDDLQELEGRQEELAEQVEKAAASAGEDDGGEASQQAIEDLRGDLAALEQRVDALAEQSGGAEGTQTTP